MNSPLSSAKRWTIFLSHLSRTLKLWTWFLALLTTSRIFLFALNYNDIVDGAQLSEIFKALWIGFRFDLPVATIFTLPSFLATFLCFWIPISTWVNKIRKVSAFLFNLLWVIITPITLIYFNEFHSQFNAHMLGILYDDQVAIFQTIYNSYPVIPIGLTILTLFIFLIWVSLKWISQPYSFPPIPRPKNIFSSILFSLILIAFLAFSLRGSLGRRPMQAKDAARTGNLTLNRCIINPFTSLHYAIKKQRRLMRSNGMEVFLKTNHPLADFQEFAGRDDIKTVDDAFKRISQEREGRKPQHIFLIVMESYDGWTMLPEYANWHVSDELKSLASKGIYIKHFLSGSSGTMTSLATLIAGMADAGVVTNERSHPGQKPFATAIAPQMQKLGYETHFYYAGYGSWQRIEDFCLEQGFQKTHMGGRMNHDADTNEWGVSDKHLFSFVKKNFNPDVPSFNIIMTSSNHPPYSLDLDKEHCPITSVPSKYQHDFAHGTTTLQMLGHHWYSDHWMGDFVKSIEKLAPDTLFAITGDHWNRKNPRPNPPAFERAIVPLVLYAPHILPKIHHSNQLCGSHYDINATLLELASPSNFTYFAIGRNILKTTQNDVAISSRWLLSNNAIAGTQPPHYPETLKGSPLPTLPENMKKAYRQYQLIHAISWWRLVKGNTLPSQ